MAKPKAAERLVMSVPEAGRMLGLGRNASYEAVKRGEIPVLRFGKLLKVSRIWLERVLRGETGEAA